MAETIVSPVANMIIRTLGTASVKKIGELYSVSDDLRDLQDTLLTIKAVLLDAEKQQTHNNQVSVWLQRLEDVVSDADDLVDGVATEGLRRDLMPGWNKVLKKARIFCSSSNQLIFRSKLAKEIRSIRGRLDKIADDRNKFKLEESREEIPRGRRETYSFIAEESVVGRVDDRRRVLELVMEESEVEDRVRVIPIFGMGGLGKTTLAQLVFNDKSVQDRFAVKSWVCVSDNFDVKVILGLIVKSLSDTSTRVDDTKEGLVKSLREKMDGKRYLLVLDDVWNENHKEWQDLMDLLSNCGDSGCRIIVTTRSESIAKLTASNKVQPCRLGILSDDESWSLFEKIAFKQGLEAAEAETVEIGKQIVKKCGGVPLAIRMISSMLSSRDPKTEWSSFLKKELSSLPQQENDVLPMLKLSYDCLPSHLKHCFAYCRLFPKDSKINVQELINAWVAQGLVSMSSDGSQSLEEEGYDHFLELFGRCFFQEAKRDKYNKVIRCKMHDLVHDLAIQVAGNKYVILEPSSQESMNFEKVRHVSYGFQKNLPISLLQAKRLRSLLRPTYGVRHAVAGLNAEAIVSNCKLLRMLDLRFSHLEIVPSSIGKLKHLRYLDLSDNYFKVLPLSITMIVNLQTLKMNNCPLLRELPRDMKKLVNLRHLEFRCWKQYPLQCLPRGVSQLTNLQTLSYFPLSEDPSLASRSGMLDELMGLRNLKGKLEIRGLRGDMETSSANLNAKEHLQILSLRWSESSTQIEEQEKTLEGLQPHANLKELYIESYGGVTFSNWLSSLTNLAELHINSCGYLKQLPSLDPLHFLKKMSLKSCKALEYIITDVNDNGCSPKTEPAPVLPSLQILDFDSLCNFRGWQSPNITENVHQQPLQLPSYFPSLTVLLIRSCSKLTSMPLYPNVEDLILEDANRKPFEQTICGTTSTSSYRLSKVELLHLSCPHKSNVRHFPDWMQGLSSLKLLAISEDERQDDSQSMAYDEDVLKWTIEASDECELLARGNFVTWKVFLSIRGLILAGAPVLKYISIASQYLTSLETLRIIGNNEAELSWDGSDTVNWGALASLRTVEFLNLPNLVALPEWLHRFTACKELRIRNCDSLMAIPDSICELSSLQLLDISRCSKIKSLPESIISFTSLQQLMINNIPISDISLKFSQLASRQSRASSSALSE